MIFPQAPYTHPKSPAVSYNAQYKYSYFHVCCDFKKLDSPGLRYLACLCGPWEVHESDWQTAVPLSVSARSVWPSNFPDPTEGSTEAKDGTL